MTDLGGIPFPYEANAMPRFPTSLQGTWVQGHLITTVMRECQLHKAENRYCGCIFEQEVLFSAENLEFIYLIVIIIPGKLVQGCGRLFK